MLTRAGSNPQRHQDMAIMTIKLLEKTLDTLELTEEMTKSDTQSVLRLSKLQW